MQTPQRGMKFRRLGTLVFGALACATLMSFAMVVAAEEGITPLGRVATFGVMGTCGFIAFRAAIWPSVTVYADSIVVRNLFADYRMEGTAEIDFEHDGSPVLVHGEATISLFAFSPSLTAHMAGDRTLLQLQETLASRAHDSRACPVVTRSTMSIARQFLLFQAVLWLAVGVLDGASALLR